MNGIMNKRDPIIPLPPPSEKKKSPFEIIDWFFSEPVRHIQSAESILAGFSLILRSIENMDCGLRTTDYGLGIKRELSITDWV